MSVPNPIVLDMDVTEPQSIQMTVAESGGSIGMTIGTVIQVGGAGVLQDKAMHYTPDVSAQTDVFQADEGYDALGEVTVNIAAMPSGSAQTPATTITANPTISVDSGGLITATASATKSIAPTVNAGYVSVGTAGTVTVSGSATQQMPTKTAADLSASGDTVTAAAGFYPSAVSKAVASGSAQTPSVNVEANPTISVDSSGLITASYSKTEAITPIVSAGYVTTGTAGNVTFAGSASSQLASKTAADLTVSASTVTAASGFYPSSVSATVAGGYLGAATVIAGQTATTKTYKVERQSATSGWYDASTVRNAGTVTLNLQSITATPDQTTQTFAPGNAVSYISQVTVSPIPSQYIVPSGTLSITSNASGIDVTSYAFADVAIPAPVLESKSITLTPSTAAVSSSVTYGAGYDGLSEVDVTVSAIPTASYSLSMSASYGNVGGRMFMVKPRETVTTAGWIPAGTVTGNEWMYPALTAATITPTAASQTIGSANTMLEGAQTVDAVVCANLTAENIKDGVVVKIGTASDDDSVTSVTGSYQGGITPTGTITLSSNATGVDVASYAFADVAVPWTWMGDEPTIVNSSFYSDSYLLGSTSYNGWAGSTTAKAIVASASAGTFVASSMSQYEYLIQWQMDVDVTLKSTATKKATPIRECANVYQLITRRPNSMANITNDNFNGNTAYTFFTAPFMQYWNTSGSSTYTWSNSYGFYGTVQTPTFSNATAESPTVTLKTPIWYARCSASYFATGRVGDVDQTATTLKRTCKIYRVKAGTAPKEIYEGLVGIINHPL